MTSRFSSAGTVCFALAVLFGAGCTKQAKFERALARGEKHLVGGQFDAAEAEFESALQLRPDDPKVAGRLGVLYFNQGRIVPCYLLLDLAQKKDPGNLEVRLAYGLVAQALSRTVEARAAARTVLEAQPANEDALLLLAETCVTTRDNEEARGIIEGLRERNPPSAGFHVALGVLRLAQRDPTGAESELKKALEINPKSSAAHAYLGSLFLARGETEQGGGALKAAAELAPLRSPRRLRYIEHLMRTGGGEEARKQLTDLTAKAPDYIPALTLEMNVAFTQRQYAESGAIAEKILIRDRTNHDALSQRAAVRMAQGDVEGAIGALKLMEDLYSRSALVKYRLAHAHLRKSEAAVAEEYLNKALLLAPDFDDAILLLAEINLQKGNAVTAASALTELLKRQPRAARAYVLLAEAHQVQGDSTSCLKVLRAFSAAYPKVPDGPYLSAVVLTQLGKKEEARRSLEQAVQAGADYWPALEMLVNDDLVEGRIAAARERVRELLEKYPKQSVPLMLDAKVALQEGDEARARANLLKAIELVPNEPQAYVFLARTYLRAKQPQQAVETLAALAAKSNRATTYMQLGVLNGTLGNHEAARAAYEKAIAVDPKFVPALNNLAAVLSVHLGQIDKAHPFALQARELAPTDPHVLDTLGWIFFLKRQYEAALPLLRSSAERKPAEPLIQYHIGMTFYRLGQEEAANRALQQFVASAAELPVTKDARDCLATLAINGATAGPEVRRELESRLAQDPNDPVVLTRLAAIEARDGAHERAASHFEAALKINPRATNTLLALSELYAGPLINRSRALELARSAHALAPQDGELAWKLGRIAFGLGEVQWAATALRAAARNLSDQPELQFDLAQATYSLGQVSEAERALEEALKATSFTKRREEGIRLAAMITAAKSPAQALAALSEARRILVTEPDYVPAMTVVALAQEQNKDFKGAREVWEKILVKYPLFSPATRQLALLYAEQLGDDKKAEELALKARQAFPDDAELAASLGKICYRRGDYAAATPYLKQSVRKRDNVAETLFYLGMAEFQLKNVSESRTSLQRALRLNLPPQEATEAKRLLEQLKSMDGAR